MSYAQQRVNNEKLIELDLSDLSTGYYSLSVNNDMGTVLTKKIFKD